MFLKNLRRKPTAIYITYSIMVGVIGYLGLFKKNLIFSVAFFWFLLLGFILISRYGGHNLIKIKLRADISLDRENKERVPIGKMLGFLFLTALPFYYVWFLVFFLASMHFYFSILLNLPILALSFLAFLAPFQLWKELGAKGWIFWCFHVSLYMLIQILGWGVRLIWLSDFYI